MEVNYPSGGLYSPYNILPKVYEFWRMYGRRDRERITFIAVLASSLILMFKLSQELYVNVGDIVSCIALQVLLAMHRSGRVFPDGKWIIERTGASMREDRMECAWRLLTSPATCSANDMRMVYTDSRDWPAGYDADIPIQQVEPPFSWSCL